MRFDILTLFPGLFDSFLRESLIGKAVDRGVFEVGVVDIRDFTEDPHRCVDDRPYGGGPGMVLKPEPLSRAIRSVRGRSPSGGRAWVILLTPAGRPLNQAKVEEFTSLDQLVMVCGRYEGIDERITRTMIDEEISVGDYVLSGGRYRPCCCSRR